MSESGTERDEPMKVGSRKTVRVSIVMDYIVEVEVPPQADLGEHADHELFLTDRWDDYHEKDIVHSEILDEEPIYEDERDEEDWPTCV